MNSIILELKAVSRRFGGVAAVDNITVRIPKGSIVGLIGPNGAGKTTLLQIISGLQSPDEGQIWFKEQDITKSPAHKRAMLGIGRAFQIVQPLIGMNVIENVTVAALFGRYGHRRGVGEARDFAASVLQRVSLLPKRFNYMSELTLANTKRLELARALATEPDLLLLDEVMAGLNHSEVASQMELLKDVNASGLTLIVVEHVMKAVMGVSDAVLVLHHGRQIAFASPQNVVNDPDVVRAYLGERYASAH